MDNHSDCSHLTDTETEAPRGYVTCCEWQSGGTNLGLSDSKPRPSTPSSSWYCHFTDKLYLQMTKLMSRGCRDHIARKWQSWDSSPASPDQDAPVGCPTPAQQHVVGKGGDPPLVLCWILQGRIWCVHRAW